ncbi:zinc finger CCHC domain-containing protein 3 [Astyanax mexicanus]|uniref:zinc finger CCHC domain-containing protein 3 n=1 Tax=Astyanax mexicanus TaxID=7994 RepID=UPI0020CAB210|nr:zinc finger CCHC domain-containing protein 3 [Astyanax mexicanus]XP_049319016.1 zinc finger CCHC domain-containing protein 3 [Astyanax mexicanus]
MASQPFLRDRYARFWAKLKYVGPGEPPDRTTVGHLILDSQWITAQDLLSFIAQTNRKEFEVCFHTERGLKVFMDSFTHNLSKWKDFEIFTPSHLEVKNIFVKLWTGRICDEDVETYLKRYCDILKPVEKPVDNLGIWYGVRKYTVKIKRDTNGQLLTIPSSFSLGPYNGKISYQGQTQTCFICQSSNHQAKECKTTKCWRCGTTGHKPNECTNSEKCSLCGKYNHNYFRCPDSYANKMKRSRETVHEENGNNIENQESRPEQSIENNDPPQVTETPEQNEDDKSAQEDEHSGSVSEEDMSQGSKTASSDQATEGPEEESYESATDEEFSSDSLTPVTKEAKEVTKTLLQKERKGATGSPSDIYAEGKRKLHTSSESEGMITILPTQKTKKKK